MRKNLISAYRALFSQQAEKKNIFVMPKRHEIRAQCLNQTQVAIQISRSCSILAALLKDNIRWFTDLHISILFKHLRVYNLDIDDSFHTVIAPISHEYVKCFSREQAMVLYEMMMTMLELKIDNPQLMNAIIHKLDQENIYRYICLYQAGQLLNQLLSHENLRDLPLTKKLIGVVYQQKSFYMSYPEPMKVVKQILKKMQNYQGTQPKLTQAYNLLV